MSLNDTFFLIIPLNILILTTIPIRLFFVLQTAEVGACSWASVFTPQEALHYYR